MVEGWGQGVGGQWRRPLISFPERLGRLGAAASTANLLDDVEGHTCGEARRVGKLEL